jgi:DNA-binding SARP family transcriptional activator
MLPTFETVRDAERERRSNIRRLPADREARLQIGLLSGFQLVHGERAMHVPLSVQRVLAFLALHERPLQRVYVAGTLWLDANEERANASLRTALWRASRVSDKLVAATPTHVALASDVEVDVRVAEAAAKALNGCGSSAARDDATPLLRSGGEILPDWYEDWVLMKREHFRQRRLHALESLCHELTLSRRFVEAIDAGLAAVEAEPLRESAHRVLVQAYLSEGNPGEALRQYRYFQGVLAEQLGLKPSPLMAELVASL